MSEQNQPQNSHALTDITHFFDADTSTFSYIAKDPNSQSCAIIDPVLGFDYAAGSTNYHGADLIIEHVKKAQLQVEWILETHVHADHLSAAPYLQQALGGRLAIGEHIVTVQKTFAKIFNEGKDFYSDGTQFDHLLKDGEHFTIGNLSGMAIHTPGHTPACMTYVIGDAAFVGDTLFMPDAGTARADFPGGDAATLFDSIQKIYHLPDNTRMFMCHDYQPNDRELKFETSVGEQKRYNVHVGENIDKQTFVKMREERDETLAMPRLIFPSLQVNMRAGHFPAAESNGKSYLKVPVNFFKASK